MKLVSSLAFRPLFLAILAGCSVGEIAVDAGPGGGGGDGCFERVNPAPAYVHTIENPNNAANVTMKGESCIEAGCHLAGFEGPDAPTWTIAGTLFSDTGGNNPAPGALIKFSARNDDTDFVTAITDTDGNFYSDVAVTFPGNALASGCPTTDIAMFTPILDGQGSCNAGGCHQAPGAQVMFLLDQ